MRFLHLLAERGYSGGEVQLELLLQHLQGAGHDNHLALVPGAAFAEIGERLGVPIHPVGLRRGWLPWHLAKVRRLVRRLMPDVVHFGCGRSLLWGGLAARGLPVKLRYTTRRIDYPIGSSWWRGGRYRHLVDHVVANCESVRQQVLGAGVPAERVTLVHEGIKMAPWSGLSARREAARATLGLERDALVVSCAATLRPRKGQAVLMEAFARIAPDLPEATLVLAGGGSDLAILRAKAQAMPGGERILVPGPISPVQDLYSASDIFCMPSFNEGLSNACLEASAAGLPLIVTSVGGLPEITVDGVTGAVVPPGDVAALAAALRRFAEDSKLRARAGEAGSKRTHELFSDERMALTTERLLQGLVDRA